MGKQILSTLVWTVIFFVLLAVVNYSKVGDGWLMETLDWGIPSAVGYFLGYRHALINEDR